jgi:AcrR family transcriptional regulator
VAAESTTRIGQKMAENRAENRPDDSLEHELELRAQLTASAASERETKGERTAKRLLEIAVQRFGDRGFRATSVSEVAREAGLTQAAVYAYFESKTALFDAAVDHDAEAVIARAQREVAGVGPLELIPALLVSASIALDDHPLVRRVLRGEEPEALGRLLNLPALAEFTASLAETLTAARDEGTVRADLDPQTFAEGAETITLALLLGMEQLRNEIEDHRRAVVAAFFASSLRPFPSAESAPA